MDLLSHSPHPRATSQVLDHGGTLFHPLLFTNVFPDEATQLLRVDGALILVAQFGSLQTLAAASGLCGTCKKDCPKAVASSSGVGGVDGSSNAQSQQGSFGALLRCAFVARLFSHTHTHPALCTVLAKGAVVSR